MVSSLIFPRRVQQIFFGKDLVRLHTHKTFSTFLECVKEKRPSNLDVSSQGSDFQVDGTGLISTFNTFNVIFRAKCYVSSDGSYIEGRFQYDFIAKLSVIVFLVAIAALSCTMGNLFLGLLMFYLSCHMVGHCIFVMGLVTADRELATLEFIRRCL
jgi:hypothetical protein